MLTKKIYIKKSTLIIVGIILVASIFSMLTLLPQETNELPKAKVMTSFGCADSLLTVEEFKAQQKFSQQLLGYHFVRCG